MRSTVQHQIKIRPAIQADAERIIDFNIEMAMETESKGLPRDIITAGVRKVLQEPQLGFYVVAELDKTLAGCLMITKEWSDWRNGLFWWIQSVYVKPVFRRQGIYGRLHTHIRELAQKNDRVCGLRLYVEKNNIIAQKTYQNLGMQATHYKIFEETIT